VGRHERDWDTIPPLIYFRIEGGEMEENNGIISNEKIYVRCVGRT